VELYLYSPNTPSWRGAQLGGAQGQLYSLYCFISLMYISLITMTVRRKFCTARREQSRVLILLGAQTDFHIFISCYLSCTNRGLNDAPTQHQRNSTSKRILLVRN